MSKYENSLQEISGNTIRLTRTYNGKNTLKVSLQIIEKINVVLVC